MSSPDSSDAWGDPPSEPTRRPRYLAGLLEALFPGLGHLVDGRAARAALFGVPILFLLALLAGFVAANSGIELAGLVVDDRIVWGLVGLQLAVLAWRLVGLTSSLRGPGLPPLGRLDVLPVLVLAALVAVPQGALVYVTNTARETVDQVFAPADQTTGAWQPSSSPASSPDASSGASGLAGSAAPSPSPSALPPRINVLLIGVDAGVGRHTFLTDTLIVASLDPVARTVSMVSIPRDTVDVPLPDGTVFRGKINSLLSYSRHHQSEFPGSNGQGYDVLMGALGTLLRLDINYYAQVDLGGFVSVVNSLGGVNVNVAHSFCDSTYHEYGYEHGFAITAGLHHLNGNQALAYARVRKAAGESDFTRQARQQEVISGIRDAVVRGGFLQDPVGFLRAVGQTVQTNVPRKLVSTAADLATHIGRSRTYRVVIGHPLVKPGFDARGSIQLPDLVAIRKLAAAIFPAVGTLPSDSFAVPAATASHAAGSGVSGCAKAATPRPTNRPTPKPTPRPTPKRTPVPSTKRSVAPSPSPSPDASAGA